MITFLVLEDEKKVYELLTGALRGQGYSFVDEPESGGIIKIIKKNGQEGASLGERMLEFKSMMLKTQEGQVYQAMLEEVEKPLIVSVLEQAEGNQLRAAKILGINRNTLRVKMKKLGISIEKWRP